MASWPPEKPWGFMSVQKERLVITGQRFVFLRQVFGLLNMMLFMPPPGVKMADTLARSH
jgi:hypothetical protein